MTEEASIPADPRDALQLTLSEPEVSSEQPWQDDELGREQIAVRLTNLIRNQTSPFVISIDGQWGTGKTFLLKRWQKDLERDQFRAIYYNAWEDDFCDDPLLSIIGQLSEQFSKGKFKELAKQAGQIAVQLIKQNLIAVPSKLTGIDLSVDMRKLEGRDLLEEYLNQRKTKDRLKEQLTQLSAAVASETQHPLVFIIDELDRCRPTFAIELLERVKHIFDVPNMVFIFGVNRDELCKSLQSVYGRIEADIYLRRFFDMEFRLPEANTRSFCTNIMARFGLHEYFRTRSTDPFFPANRTDYGNLSEVLPMICSVFELSLRDIVYCIGLVSCAIRNLSENQKIYPWPLGVLIPLKLSDLTLFRRFVRGDCYASDVMNYINDRLSLPIEDNRLNLELTNIEAELYLLETARLSSKGESTPYHQLNQLARGSAPSHPHLLSNSTQQADPDRATGLLNFIDGNRIENTPRNAITELAKLIDFYDAVMR